MLMTFAVAAIPAAETWYPAPGWHDRPDPVASVRAKKGGTLRFNGSQPPKGMNAYIDSNTYTKMTFELMYETLLGIDAETLDFVPCLAKRWSVSADGTVFTFVLDERAKWSDGRSVCAEDVRWTFEAVTAAAADTGSWKMILGSFEPPEAIAADTVRFRKKPGSAEDWRDLINCAMFYILPAHAFAGKDFNKLELVGAPVSGPYRLSRIEEQVESEFTRVTDWWRRDFPSCRHICNFDRILMRYFIDNENAFEALKKRQIDVYPVYTARIMAGETHGEKFDRNWILKRRVRNRHPLGFQGFAMNMRRAPFDRLKVREAMAKLIDRETMNRTMMHGEYFLQNSCFQDLYDEAHPCTNAYHRYDVAAAKKQLAEAGYPDGFTFTFLSRSSTEDKFLALFSHALSECGVKMEIVRKDFAGWMRDMDSYNYDMTWASWGAGVFRSPETMWLSTEADRRGSGNITGFRSAEADAIIAAEKKMRTMAERLDAYRRLDAIICAQAPYAFLWNIAETRLLYWNKFGMPEKVLSLYGDEDAVLTYWWYDPDRAEELRQAMADRTCLPPPR